LREIANLIGTQTVWYNDPNLVNTAYEKLAAVTAEKVKQAAQKYLVPWHRAVVITVPEALGVVSGAAAAETRQLPSKVERLNKVPINHEILKVKLPHPVEPRRRSGRAIRTASSPWVCYSLWTSPVRLIPWVIPASHFAGSAGCHGQARPQPDRLRTRRTGRKLPCCCRLWQ
jgi:hypothetical protein